MYPLGLTLSVAFGYLPAKKVCVIVGKMIYFGSVQFDKDCFVEIAFEPHNSQTALVFLAAVE